MTTRHYWAASRVVLTMAIVALLGVGAGCSNPFKKDPEKILRNAYEQSLNAKSSHVHGTVSAQMDTPESETGSARIDIVFDAVEVQHEDGSSDGQGTVHFTVEIGTSGSVTVDLETRTIGYDSYLRLSDLSVNIPGEQGSQAGLIVGLAKGVLGGKWISITREDVMGFAALSGEAVPQLPSDDELRTIEQHLEVVARENMPLVVRENLGKERLDGVKAYHYRVGFQKEAIVAIAREAISSLGATTGGGIGAAQLDAVIAALDGDFGTHFAQGSGEVWISTKGQELLRIVVPVAYTDPKTGGSIEGTVDFRYTDWNAPVVVEVPEDAQPLQTVLGGLLGGALGGGLAPSASGLSGDGTSGDMPRGLPVVGSGDDESVDSTPFESGDADGDGLSDVEEAFYGSDPTNPDTDGDGYSDGDEVGNGYSPTGPGTLFEVNLGE